MPFPYRTPLPSWVVEVMKQREKNKISAIYKNPFAILTSTALVVKGGSDILSGDKAVRQKATKDILEKPKNVEYQGCIITNNINNKEY